MAKVFVIDDSLSVCFAIERLLRGRGMEVVSHRSGETALANLEQEEPDLVMCDLVLPDIEGFQICSFLQGHPKLGHVPVIVISGIVDEEVRAQAMDVGAVAVLKKPFATHEMITLVEQILQDRGVLQLDDEEIGDGEPGDGPRDDDSGGASLASMPEPGTPAKSRPILLEPEPTEDLDFTLPARPKEPVNELLDRLEARLEPLAAIETLKFACILSPAGDLRGYGPAKPTTTELAAVPQLVRAAISTAAHTRNGEVGILTLETEKGVLVVKPQEEGHLMVLGLGDLSVLGKARYMLRRLELDDGASS